MRPKGSAKELETRRLLIVAYQSWPQDLLPDELKDENPRQILRLVNGVYTDAAI
jgi:hypothetical protein